MPPYPYQLRTPWGHWRGERMRLAEIYWQLDGEEIVRLLIAFGYSEKAARAEAALFDEYRSRLSHSPPQDSGPPPEPEEGPLARIWANLKAKRGDSDAET